MNLPQVYLWSVNEVKGLSNPRPGHVVKGLPMSSHVQSTRFNYTAEFNRCLTTQPDIRFPHLR